MNECRTTWAHTRGSSEPSRYTTCFVEGAYVNPGTVARTSRSGGHGASEWRHSSSLVKCRTSHALPSPSLTPYSSDENREPHPDTSSATLTSARAWAPVARIVTSSKMRVVVLIRSLAFQDATVCTPSLRVPIVR